MFFVVFFVLASLLLAHCGNRSFNRSIETSVNQIQPISVPQNNNTVIKIDSEKSLIGHVLNFYSDVINVLSVFFVIVTVIGFIYLRNISRSDVNELVDDTVNKKFDSNFFKLFLESLLEKVFKADAGDGFLADFVKYQAENEERNYNEIKELQEKIKRLEDAVTTFQNIEEEKNNGRITLPVENVGTTDKNENH
jgi:hypothetical protein